MPISKKILFIGCGDLAQGCIPAWHDHRVTAIARTPKPLSDGVTFWQGAVASATIGERLSAEQWDAIVITLTPDRADEEAYRSAYWVNIQYILHNLSVTAKPLILFISSTSVYGQEDGSWVDESSPTEPTQGNAQWLVNTEQFLLQQSQLPVRIVRLAGIYGPGRDFLLRQVLAGKGGNSAYTNRIHRDDACGIINFLLRRYFAGQTDPSVILASDCLPVTSEEIRSWLAQQMGVSIAPSEGLRGGNKRCCNALIQQLGYQFSYPDFQKGYAEALLSFKK